MKKAMLLCGMLLALTAAVASAAPGVNLRWTACIGDGGAPNRTSTCTSNLGSAGTLVGSYELPNDIALVTGIECVVDLAAADVTLPAWWTYNAPGGTTGCRGTALAVNPTISGAAVNCIDWAQGTAAGGLAAYQVGLYGANTARIKIGFAVAPPGLDVFGGFENFAFNIVISNAKTVGTGNCAGCTTPVCLVCNSILVVPGTNPGTKLIGPTNGTDSNFATWQGGGVPGTALGTGCPAATPTKNATWGSVKALYR